MSGRRRTALALSLTALAMQLGLALPAAAPAGDGHAPRRLGLAKAAHLAKERAAHTCEALDNPPPCHVVSLESCARLTARKVECGVAVTFPDGREDCVWTVYVFWKQGEFRTSEGRSDCEPADRAE